MADAKAPDTRRRLPAPERRAQLIERAAQAFAADGFSVSTRQLARHMGVTQALLYKYFASKEALVDAVLQARFLAERPGPDPALLAGDDPLEERIARFYGEFVSGAAPAGVRLFLRASLDGLDLPARYSRRLDQRFLFPLLEALRREARLPDLAQRPATKAERELALMLHGALVFTLIRKEIYRIDFPVAHAALVALHARVYTPGALREIGRLNADDAAPLPLYSPRDDPL